MKTILNGEKARQYGCYVLTSWLSWRGEVREFIRKEGEKKKYSINTYLLSIRTIDRNRWGENLIYLRTSLIWSTRRNSQQEVLLCCFEIPRVMTEHITSHCFSLVEFESGCATMIGYVLRHSNIGIKCTEVSYPSFFKNENAMKNACCSWVRQKCSHAHVETWLLLPTNCGFITVDWSILISHHFSQDEEFCKICNKIKWD